MKTQFSIVDLNIMFLIPVTPMYVVNLVIVIYVFLSMVFSWNKYEMHS